MTADSHFRRFLAALGRQRAALALALAFALAALAVFPWDRAGSAALLALHAGPWKSLTDILLVFGQADVLITLALVAGALGRRKQAAGMILALGLVMLLVWPLKIGVARERPAGGAAVSFPSGDTGSAAAVAVPLASGSLPGAILGGLLTTGVAGTRVMVGKHYPSDVLAGIALGLVAGAGGLALAGRFRRLPAERWFAAAALAGPALRLLVREFAGGGDLFARFVRAFGPLLLVILAARAASSAQAGAARWWAARLGSGGTPLRQALAAALLIAALFGLLASASTLWDRDEPRFARAAVEMVSSGNYLYPTFNGALRPDKPVLIYWLMSIPLRLSGPAELAVRFFAPLGTALAALALWAAGRRLVGGGAALAAMGITALTPLMMVSGSAATTDAVLLAWIVAALALFATTEVVAGKPLPWPAMGAVLGGAMLTKGPVGLAFPALAVAGALLWGGRAGFQRGRVAVRLVLAAALGVGVFLLWALPANRATGGEFAAKGLGDHVVHRLAAPMESHGGSFWLYLPYYLVVIALFFFPWTLFLPGALSALWGGRLVAGRGRAFLIGTIVPGLILMTLVATKLPHYILPLFPFLALGVAGVISAAERRHLAAADERWLARGIWLFAPVGLLSGLAAIVLPWRLELPRLVVPGLSLGLVLVGTTFLAARAHARRRWSEAGLAAGSGAAALLLALVFVALPRIEELKITPALAGLIRSRTGMEVPVATYQFFEPSLVFYLDRGPVEQIKSARGLERRLAGGGPLVLVGPETIPAAFAPDKALPEFLGKVTGYNFSNGKRITVAAWLIPGRSP